MSPTPQPMVLRPSSSFARWARLRSAPAISGSGFTQAPSPRETFACGRPISPASLRCLVVWRSGCFVRVGPVQGSMFSGEVVEVGADVTRFAVGDRVFGDCGAGGWAETVVVDAQSAVAHLPDGVTYDEAAAVPYGAGSAMHFLREVADVKPGEHVLLLGGSGGVGRFAIQVAKHLGARVTAVASARNHEQMRELGADAVLDYRTQDFTKTGEQYDVILDVADASRFRHSRRSLRDGGRYVSLYISLRVLFWSLVTSFLARRRAMFSIAVSSRPEHGGSCDVDGRGCVEACDRGSLSAAPDHRCARRGGGARRWYGPRAPQPRAGRGRGLAVVPQHPLGRHHTGSHRTSATGKHGAYTWVAATIRRDEGVDRKCVERPVV